jgi:hypothetical protein
MAHDALRRGRSADVPHADEQDSHRPQATPHRSPARPVGDQLISTFDQRLFQRAKFKRDRVDLFWKGVIAYEVWDHLHGPD